jgi:NADH dehydrogenase
MHWTITFLSNDRSQRTTTQQQVFARRALNRLPGGAAELVSPPAPHDRLLELEERAAEEARLTDSGQRGRAVEHAVSGRTA